MKRSGLSVSWTTAELLKPVSLSGRSQLRARIKRIYLFGVILPISRVGCSDSSGASCCLCRKHSDSLTQQLIGVFSILFEWGASFPPTATTFFLVSVELNDHVAATVIKYQRYIRNSRCGRSSEHFPDVFLVPLPFPENLDPHRCTVVIFQYHGAAL